eukprot:SM000021S06414  [mRNA]  locus=s21:129930:140406:+ [translate_table: standard]
MALKPAPAGHVAVERDEVDLAELLEHGTHSLRSSSSLHTRKLEDESAAAMPPGPAAGGLDRGGPHQAAAAVVNGGPDLIAKVADAPQSVLIHMVASYHAALLSHGLTAEATVIVEELEAFLAERRRAPSRAPELQGFELLLKDGLLEFLLRVQPLLPPIRSQVVKFKDVSFVNSIVIPDGFPTVGSLLGGCLLREKPKKVPVTVVKNATGYFMPGSMTLILGSPGCGKSTLLRILTGRIKDSPGLSGSVLYNHKPVREVIVERLAACIAAQDNHQPFLTVKETMEFSRDCTLAWTYKDFGPELKAIAEEALKLGQDPKLEMNLHMMGLKRLQSRPVGSEKMPTLTAGERHRVTVAEMVAGTYAVYYFDELNKGVDASVTRDLVENMKIFSRVRGVSCVVSLLQPSVATYNLFDQILLMDHGHILYFGPRADALPYFENLGYIKPLHVCAPEFLVDVTTEEGWRFLQPGAQRLEFDGFVQAYQNSDLYKDTLRIVESPELHLNYWVQASKPPGIELANDAARFPTVKKVIEGQPLSKPAIQNSGRVKEGDRVVAVSSTSNRLAYVVGHEAQAVAGALELAADPVRLQLERPFVEQETTFGVGQYNREYVHDFWYEIVVLGLFVGTFFFQLKQDANQLDMNLRRGIGFSSVMTTTLINLGHLPFILEDRLIFYKQQGARFYRPASYLLAQIFSQFPFSFTEASLQATIWSILVYFIGGLTLSSGGWHFFVYWALFTCNILWASSMVRFLGNWAPTPDAANAVSGIIIALFLLFAGFLVPRFKIPHYWIWMYYLSPLQWAITSFLINEFRSSTYSNQYCRDVSLALVPQCIGRLDEPIGRAWLAKNQFLVDYGWIAVGFVVLLAWFAVFNLLSLWALTKVRHVPLPREGLGPPKKTSEPSKDNQVEDEIDEELGPGMKGQAGEQELSIKSSSLLDELLVPITLSWHNLGYELFNPQIGQSRRLLDDISGWTKPGEILLLLGAGGAGKSTLLNCLAGRYVSPHNITGKILVNGYPKIQATFSRVMAYVDRSNAYSPFVTVREACLFSAALRMGKTITKEQQVQFVDEVLDVMGLTFAANRLVLSLSGPSSVAAESSKRLCTAIELSANPSMLFLDEPLSNVDSRSALKLIETLKNITRTRRGVIMTASDIPSNRRNSLFTNALILKNGGEMVYFGPLSADSAEMKAYFCSIPGTPPCLPGVHPLQYVIDLIGDGSSGKMFSRNYAFEYKGSLLCVNNDIELDRIRQAKGKIGLQLTTSGNASSLTTQAVTLITRMQLQYWRNLNYSFGRLMSAVILGLLLGSTYWQENYESTPGMNARAGSLFASCLLLAISNAMNIVPQLAAADPGFKRELATSQYHVFFYGLSWALAEIPYLMVMTLIYSGIFCGMSGVATADVGQFFQFWFILFEFVLAITFLGMLLSTVMPKPALALIVIPILISLWVPSNGYVVVKRKVVDPYIWLFWSNPLQYALNALTSLVFFCNTDGPLCKRGGQNLMCAINPAACPMCTCPRLHDTRNVFVWDTISASRSLNHSQIGLDMMALALFSVFFRVASYLALRYLRHNRQT